MQKLPAKRRRHVVEHRLRVLELREHLIGVLDPLIDLEEMIDLPDEHAGQQEHRRQRKPDRTGENRPELPPRVLTVNTRHKTRA